MRKENGENESIFQCAYCTYIRFYTKDDDLIVTQDEMQFKLQTLRKTSKNKLVTEIRHHFQVLITCIYRYSIKDIMPTRVNSIEIDKRISLMLHLHHFVSCPLVECTSNQFTVIISQ